MVLVRDCQLKLGRCHDRLLRQMMLVERSHVLRARREVANQMVEGHVGVEFDIDFVPALPRSR
jgi:hypothetical protein